MTKPFENPPGLPRPLADHNGRMLPVPWTQQNRSDDCTLTNWGRIDGDRQDLAFDKSLCLLCGEPVETGVVLMTEYAARAEREDPGNPLHRAIDSGPLHHRCAKLTRAHCPHLRDGENTIVDVPYQREGN